MKCNCTTDYVCVPHGGYHRGDCPVKKAADALGREMPKNLGHVEWSTQPLLSSKAPKETSK
jgi:hypothetical protein